MTKFAELANDTIAPAEVLTLSIEGVLSPSIWQSSNSDIAVILVNGGAQTRVGSHRQYIKLSRSLAKKNIASLRFDLPGFGDHPGQCTDFLKVSRLLPDVCHQLLNAKPKIKRLILLGLCDGASAILLSKPFLPSNCIGFIVINPWLRQENTYAHTMLKDYYLKRLATADLWLNIFRGNFAVNTFYQDIRNLIKKSWQKQKPYNQQKSVCNTPTLDNFTEIIKAHWQQSKQQIMVITAGQDLIANEFLNLCRSDKQYNTLLETADWRHANDANHTFASITQQLWLEKQVCEFIGQFSMNKIE